MRAKNYHTRQQQIILDYLEKRPDDYITVQQIATYLKEQQVSVGLTTIYRHLDKLERLGRVHKLKLEDVDGTCFKYIPKGQEIEEPFSLRCEKCGEITYLDCDFLKDLYDHVMLKHHFNVNPDKTMFYGECETCAKKQMKNREKK